MKHTIMSKAPKRPSLDDLFGHVMNCVRICKEKRRFLCQVGLPDNLSMTWLLGYKNIPYRSKSRARRRENKWVKIFIRNGSLTVKCDISMKFTLLFVHECKILPCTCKSLMPDLQLRNSACNFMIQLKTNRKVQYGKL